MSSGVELIKDSLEKDKREVVCERLEGLPVQSLAEIVSRRYRLCARVVKGLDSKSNGVTRAGSNPAVVVLFLFEDRPILPSLL